MNSRKFNVKTSGEYKGIDEIKNTIVYSANGKNVYLKDIATVDLGYEDRVHLRLNGRRAVLITANQKMDRTFHFQGSRSGKTDFEKFEKTLPSHIKMVKVSINRKAWLNVCRSSERFSDALFFGVDYVVAVGQSRGIGGHDFHSAFHFHRPFFLWDIFRIHHQPVGVWLVRLATVVFFGWWLDCCRENIERLPAGGTRKTKQLLTRLNKLVLRLWVCTATLYWRSPPSCSFPKLLVIERASYGGDYHGVSLAFCFDYHYCLSCQVACWKIAYGVNPPGAASFCIKK